MIPNIVEKASQFALNQAVFFAHNPIWNSIYKHASSVCQKNVHASIRAQVGRSICNPAGSSTEKLIKDKDCDFE
jgi:hypothetical protein